MSEPLLIVEDLHVVFRTPRGPVEAVRGVSFELGRERLGIVGESGSGKSQTGRALLRLSANNARISARRMEFDGIDLLAAPERDMRHIRGARISIDQTAIPSPRICSTAARGVPESQASTRSGRRATMPSTSRRNASPTRGSRAAASG